MVIKLSQCFLQNCPEAIGKRVNNVCVVDTQYILLQYSNAVRKLADNFCFGEG